MVANNKNTNRFIGLTQNAWMILTSAVVLVTVGWIIFEQSTGNAAFEPLLAFLAIIIELVLGIGPHYQASLDRLERQNERLEDKEDIKNHIDAKLEDIREIIVHSGEYEELLQQIDELQGQLEEKMTYEEWIENERQDRLMEEWDDTRGEF